MNNFIGKDGFNWWQGVVEDRQDPLGIGRVKVRMFGHHTENLNLLPTKDLPWAVPSVPANGSKMFGVPDEGDYVFGFFQDGISSQAPVIMGSFPGFKTEKINTSIGFSPQGTQYANTTTPKGDTATDIWNSAIGQQSTSSLARGNVSGTQIYKTNNNLAHACDVNFILNFNLGLGGLVNPVTAIQNAIRSGQQKAAQIIRMMIMKVNEYLKKALDAIIFSLAFDKTGVISFTISEIKAAIAKINQITKKIAEIVEIASMVASLAQQIKQLIAYFQSLPAKILALVKDCIAGITNSIQNTLSQLQSIPGAVGGNLTDVLNNFLETTQSQTPSVSTNTEIQVGNTTINISSYIDSTDANTIANLINSLANTSNTEITISQGLTYDVASFTQP
jgi:hypothetical protein